MNEKVIIRIPAVLYEKIYADLQRPHDHASERVGFMFTRMKKLQNHHIILTVHEYIPVEDKDYLRDRYVGARIGSAAIRSAMQNVLNTGSGSFHVHCHYGKGTPGFGITDMAELPKLVRALTKAAPDQVHGMFLLNEDSVTALVWLPNVRTPITNCQIVVVGFPVKKFPQKKSIPAERYKRQSFLGVNSMDRIKKIKIGIVGLGGGGSHVVQQLAHIGFQDYVIFDNDVIEESNLNRLVGATVEDVIQKRKKVVIAERMIKGLQPNAKVTIIPTAWQLTAEELQLCDIVIGCVDSLVARRDLESECRRYLIPYLDIGMDVAICANEKPRVFGQIILSLPGYPCMQCLRFLNDKNIANEVARYGDAGDHPQVVWSNGILASMAVGIVIDLVTGWNCEKLIYYLVYDGNKNTVVDHVHLSYAGSICKHYVLEEAGPPVWKVSSKISTEFKRAAFE